MVKLIFLDVDGVLCTEAVGFAYPKLDPAAVGVLNGVLERTGARIVVSSTWRNPRSVTATRELLGGLGRVQPANRIIGCTPDLQDADHLHLQRGHEIQAWLDRWAKPVEGIAIVDDDGDMVHLQPYLVRTDSRRGLTADDGERLERMLARPFPGAEAGHAG